MKTKIRALISLLTFFSFCNAQPEAVQNKNDLEQIYSVFDRIEVQGVDSKQDLLYGYFFFGNDRSKLEKLENYLTSQSYRFVELVNRDKDGLILHVEKVESHSRQSLYERGKALRLLAGKYDVLYDGFDVGNKDPAKPLFSDEIFSRFKKTKNGNELFRLGTKLYELEIHDKAEIVFKECLRQNIKPDTAAYKLGNTLINENKLEEGINALVQATKYNPKYFYAFFNLGATCYDSGKFQESIQYYQQANQLKPNDDRAIYGIAAAQYAAQQFEKSLENCKKALVLNKDNENAKQLMQMLQSKVH